MLRTRSTQATIAPAVVNEPPGSANTDTSKGGTMAALAATIISRARLMSLPPMKKPVRGALCGGREKMASCTSGLMSASVTLS